MSSDRPEARTERQGQKWAMGGLGAFLLSILVLGSLNTYRHAAAGTLTVDTFPIFASGLLIGVGAFGLGFILYWRGQNDD